MKFATYFENDKTIPVPVLNNCDLGNINAEDYKPYAYDDIVAILTNEWASKGFITRDVPDTGSYLNYDYESAGYAHITTKNKAAVSDVVRDLVSQILDWNDTYHVDF